MRADQRFVLFMMGTTFTHPQNDPYQTFMTLPIKLTFFPVLKHFSVLKGTFILVLFLFFSKVQKTGTQLFRDCLRLWFCFLFPQLNSFEVLLVCPGPLFFFFPALQSCGISSVTLPFPSCIACLAISDVPNHQWLLFHIV